MAVTHNYFTVDVTEKHCLMLVNPFAPGAIRHIQPLLRYYSNYSYWGSHCCIVVPGSNIYMLDFQSNITPRGTISLHIHTQLILQVLFRIHSNLCLY